MSEKYEIVKFKNDEFELDVNVDPKNETIWMSKKDISILFETDRSVISKHITKIFKDEEWQYDCNVQKVHIAGIDKPIEFFNLDIVIFIGFKVNSKKGIEFRKIANQVLKKYLLEGYVINENRVIASNENYIDLKNEVVNINNTLKKVEDKLLDKEIKLDKILFNGQFYDAYTLVQSYLKKLLMKL